MPFGSLKSSKIRRQQQQQPHQEQQLPPESQQPGERKSVAMLDIYIDDFGELETPQQRRSAIAQQSMEDIDLYESIGDLEFEPDFKLEKQNSSGETRRVHVSEKLTSNSDDNSIATKRQARRLLVLTAILGLIILGLIIALILATNRTAKTVSEPGEWGSFGPCTATCGGGTQTRSRECGKLNKTESCSTIDTQPCNLHECPIDGNWSLWSTFSLCSQTCGGGKKSRTRTCNNPKPSFYGRHCQGSPTEEIDCNNVTCLVMLKGGTKKNMGNVFALNSLTGTFGPICDDEWSIEDGHVVCRQLGYQQATKVTNASFFGSIGTDIFAFDDVRCKGYEIALEDCPHKDDDDCGATEGAGVVCK